jgi:1-acyl-sn-glycerol-3-phosphate acyltransferase
MLSPLAIKLIKILPESFVVKFTQTIVKGYIKKYARLKILGIENLENLEGPFLFICNHLSNSDGLILDYILKEKYDPFFIAGAKLSDDPITNLGTKIVKNIQVKPNTADKEAITSMVKTVRGGESLMMFPEGTK